MAAVPPTTLARNGMFGKRGETPPLPRNCERALPLHAAPEPEVNAARILPLKPPGDGKGRAQFFGRTYPRKSGDRFRRVH